MLTESVSIELPKMPFCVCISNRCFMKLYIHTVCRPTVPMHYQRRGEISFDKI